MKYENGNIERAIKILKMLKVRLKTIKTGKWPLAASAGFVNCREQGLSLMVWGNKPATEGTKFFFSENRNSDDIVVYQYFGLMGAMADSPDKKAWESAKYFSSEEKAAEYIEEQIRKFLKAN